MTFSAPNASLRAPSHVMRLSQMGAMFHSPLSFLPRLMRDLAQQRAPCRRPVWDMDAEGYGQAVYEISLFDHTYSLFVITQPLDPSQRSDRVISEAWDAAFVLHDGVLSDADRERLAANAPVQEAGRFTERDLCLSRANKSVRLFDKIIDAGRTGQPLPTAEIAKIGYVMRTTAVYGNGKFGLADRTVLENRDGLSGSFSMEMLTVWMIRNFTHDLLEHLSGRTLPDALKRNIGVGNATGLGMAPFLVSHPELLHVWMSQKEAAFSTCLTETVGAATAKRLVSLARRMSQHLLEWNVADAEYTGRNRTLRSRWLQMQRSLDPDLLMTDGALRHLWEQSRDNPDFEEAVIAWVLQGFDQDIAKTVGPAESVPSVVLDVSQSCRAFRDLIETHATFALTPDFSMAAETAQFWYVSQSKLEPRLGQRATDLGADQESPLDIARRIQALWSDLEDVQGPLSAFLLQFPDHLAAAHRVQTLAAYGYSEVSDNLISGRMRPIDLLRCKLSFFGATKFDPKSDLWTRITLGQGAPLPRDIRDGRNVEMWMPVCAP